MSTCKSNKVSNQRFPGWNEYCKDKRKDALNWHNIWKDNGRPRHGYIANMRRKSRSDYHRIVKICRKKENTIRSERMAQSLLDNNCRQFWNEVRVMRGGGVTKPPSQVDNVTGNDEIAELFADKFKDVFNSVGYDTNLVNGLYDKCNDTLKRYSNVDECLITSDDVRRYIKKLKFGKSDGNAGLFSDNFKYGTDKLFEYLVYLFNMMIIHGISPENMLVGTAIPIPKHKRINKSVSDNFRGICLQSILCKLLDMFMLEKENVSLKTSELQFGFKEGMSTDLAMAVVSETVDYYINRRGCVYMLALDATKAFDRVDFVKLFSMLFERNVSPLYIRLLFNMYLDQKIRVNFNGGTSEYFYASNGVKQGGVLSPVLFSCYINGLIDQLQKCQLGCYVGDLYIGCVAYADDIVLLSPTVDSLRGQIKIAEEFAKEHSMLFNGNKSKLVCFSKAYSPKNIRVSVGGDYVSLTDKVNYLGHSVSSNIYDSPVDVISRDFVIKFNGVISDFANTRSCLKYELMLKYCTSFYGVLFCDLNSRKGLDVLCRQWRKALRKIWSLPYRAHSKLLPLITGGLPLEIVVKKRFLNFFYSGLSSKNKIVCHMFQLAERSYSRLGCNFRALCSSALNNRGNYAGYGANHVIDKLVRTWKNGVDDDDVRIASQIRELIDIRDGILDNVLSKSECQDMIDFISTM